MMMSGREVLGLPLAFLYIFGFFGNFVADLLIYDRVVLSSPTKE